MSNHRIALQFVKNKVLNPLYTKFFQDTMNIFKSELFDCGTVLDLGCGYNSSIQYCDVSFSVGVELFDPYLQKSKKKRIHNQYIKADISKLDFKPKSFDAIICLEVLEHLTKRNGYELIGKMEKWARKKIIITTPNGYIWQDGYDNNPLQIHKSSWSPGELKNFGFKLYGMNGWKKIRGCRGSIKYKPTFLWARISDLTQKVTYYWPNLAFQLFAIKKINECEPR